LQASRSSVQALNHHLEEPGSVECSVKSLLIKKERSISSAKLKPKNSKRLESRFQNRLVLCTDTQPKALNFFTLVLF
jgi:hypothetical protein